MQHKIFHQAIFIFFLVISVFSSSTAFTQQRFTFQGEIEFEKRINMYAFIKKALSGNKEQAAYLERALEQYKTTQPQFKTMKSYLKFSNSFTLFTPEKEMELPKNNAFGDLPGIIQINTIQTDLDSKTQIIQKAVFEETFLIKDNLRKINWKITDETREIAGFQCRRANALVLDSIYVVAFYTDQIPISGGPETFTGLPGMILGLALPHDHITWFATKVNDMPVAKNTLTPPSKGKLMSQTEFLTTLQNTFKRWGDFAKPFIRFFLI
ncbi:GLPGLI family protein [Pseudoxanthomonas sp. SGD-10]|nr:GLPGLI family protein [Pseudoxanthomonas sp. SGD-10]